MHVCPEDLGVEAAHTFIPISSHGVRGEIGNLVRQHRSQLSQVRPQTRERAILRHARPQSGQDPVFRYPASGVSGQQSQDLPGLVARATLSLGRKLAFATRYLEGAET